MRNAKKENLCRRVTSRPSKGYIQHVYDRRIKGQIGLGQEPLFDRIRVIGYDDDA